jgi:predicted SAM-dependent methyltransferase
MRDARSLKLWLRRRPMAFNAARSALYAGRMVYGRCHGATVGPHQWRAYCAKHSVRKLHLGCGDFLLPGWFNTDGFPRRTGVAYCDVTRRFPFPDGVFDCVFSEHMIEHIPFLAGKFMLSECFRVLKPGGRLRVATPDLDKITALKRPANNIERAYLAFATAQIPDAFDGSPCFAINAFVRNWGHVFIYDPETLAELLRRSGFVEVASCRPDESGDPALCGIDRHAETLARPEFNLIETMVAEAVKPR